MTTRLFTVYTRLYLIVFKKLKAEKTQGNFSAKNSTYRRFLRLQPKTQKKKNVGRYLFGLMPLMSFLWTCLWIFAVQYIRPGFFWPFEKNSRRKNSKLKEKTKTWAENSNFRHFFFFKKWYSLKTYVVSGLGINITILTYLCVLSYLV